MSTDPIHDRLTEALQPLLGEQTTSVRDIVLGVLEEVGVLVPPRDRPRLATTNLRVLCDLALHPTTSLHEVAVRLSTTESTVVKAMTSLAEAGLVVRTSSGGRNRYQFALHTLVSHGDIRAFLMAIATVANSEQISPLDIT